jgi:2,3-bisphosphoglycerate-independent phosphoglycerate mutase
MNNKAALIILDGWGHGQDPDRSAIANAETPYVDGLYDKLPNTELVTYGEQVGLPEGQMGNSEVGHLNIGAGRIVYQDLAKINKSIKENTLENNPKLQEAIAEAKEKNVPIHLLGLVSDGGVHSHLNHLISLSNTITKAGVKVKIHAFLDGRDTDPFGGKGYLKRVIESVEPQLAKLVSVVGRYYAMDRDNRWERVARAYHLLVNGKGEVSNDLIQAVQDQYDQKITDEFMEPLIVNGHSSEDLVSDGDVVLFYNFRTDRPRQLTIVLTQEDHPEQDMHTLDLGFYTMTKYNKNFNNIKVLFEKEDLVNTIGEVISNKGLTQVRIAETEKYPHVTFFFSGGREQPFPGESRIMVNSPKVATYDLQPEMSAPEVTEKLITFIEEKEPDFVCINFANTDMVGHTGVMEAAMKAANTVDHCLSQLVETLEKHSYSYIIIADHGNADIMRNEDGTAHTAHTTNPVPIFVGGKGITKDTIVNTGKLGDIAPTILSLMDIEIPEEMDGDILVSGYLA